MVDPVRASRIQQKELQAEMAQLELKQALLQGNILEVRARLPAHVTTADFEKFMSDQWKTWKSQVVQDYQIYEGEGAVEDPGMRYHDFPVHGEGTSFRPGEGDEFVKGMMSSLGRKGGGFKATEIPTTPEELSNIAEGTLGEWEEFTNGMWGQIYDAQMLQDYKKRMGEIQGEVQRIIAMAKSGQIDPEYVLIALAKVNVTKNGVLMTWLGKKAFATNENMNRIAEDLKKNPSDMTAMYDAQAKTRDGAFQLQLLTADMQKVMQDVANVLEQVHGFMGEINRTRREIIQKFTAT